MNWVKAAIVAAAIAALLGGAAALRAHFVSVGDAQGAGRVQGKWDAQKRIDDAEALRLQREANAEQLRKFRNAERITDEEARRATDRARRDVAAAAVVDGLRSTIDALNRRDVSSAGDDPRAVALAQGAATARELFGSCSAAHRDLGSEADRLRDQVTGLLDYVTNVCPRPTKQATPAEGWK